MSNRLTRQGLAAAFVVALCAPVAVAQERDRSDDVHWVLALSIKDGRGDELAPLAEEMTAATEAEEGAIAYEWYRSGETVHLFERFEDSAGAMTHLDNFDAQFADRFFDLFEATGWNIYGPASDALKQRIEPMGAVFHEKVEGFAR